jgi:hypothetical protein
MRRLAASLFALALASLVFGDTRYIGPIGGGGVSQIVAGTNVTISPTGGTGAVTINASGGGGGTIATVTSAGTLTVINPNGPSTNLDTAAFAGGDCTSAAASLALTCTKTNGSAFGTAATQNTGTSGATVPLLNGINTWSGAQTLNAGETLTNAANAYTLTSTGLSLTSGTTGFGRDITGTVNDSSAVDGIIDFANVTCTLCTATSYLVDWQVGGTSQFKLTTAGVATFTGTVNSTGVSVTGTGVQSEGLYRPATHTLGFSTNSAVAGTIDTNQHWRVGANTPTIASGACGATTNGTLSAASTDQSGEIIIGAAATTTCTVSFGLAYTTAPRSVMLTPGNAAAIGATVLPYVSSIGTANFVVTGSLLASTSFYYWVQ